MTAPLRVAIIGSGPAALYTLEHLLAAPGIDLQVDVFERLPTPFGLVRAGVAPDHQKIKAVTRAFEPLLADPRVRFFAGVEYGCHLTLDDLRQAYHLVCFATGAQSDRRMNIPGEDLPGSLPATAFVAWYNGHPDFANLRPDLQCESAVVVGVGNVAIDVARILCLTPAELRRSDMPGYAIEALSASRIREVHVLGRRGPVQAAFTTPELKELTTLEDAALVIRPEEAELDPLSRAELEHSPDRTLARKVELIQQIAANPPPPRGRRLYLRFFITPDRLIAGEDGRVGAVHCQRTRLVQSPGGGLTAESTGQQEFIPAGLVLRSVGYRGRPLPGLPFDERLGTVPNRGGRVVDPTTGDPIPGLYVAGWIKRGPTGVIGTNKPDAAETVRTMLEDAAAGCTLATPRVDRAELERLVRCRQPNVLTFADWQTIDRLEREAGAACGRPRVKFTSFDDVLRALGRAPA